MKKPLTIPNEPQPRNVTRADLVMTEGFGLEVDGRMKTVFPTLEAAQKKGRGISKPSFRCSKSRCTTLRKRSCWNCRRLSDARLRSPWVQAMPRRQANLTRRLVVRQSNRVTSDRYSIKFDARVFKTNVRSWGKSGRHLLVLSVS